MASSSLDVTGKDTRVLVTMNGSLVSVTDTVTDFEARPTYDEVVTKHMGQSGSKVQKEFVGWEGSLTFTRQNAQLDELIDTINGYRRARVAYVINIASTTSFRDGTSITHIYQDVEPEFDVRTRRGEADTSTVAWKTGSDRVAA